LTEKAFVVELGITSIKISLLVLTLSFLLIIIGLFVFKF
jgi:hypothetical protein